MCNITDTGDDGKGEKKSGRRIHTGDGSHMGLWMTIALLAALELAVMAVIRKRRSR